MCATLAGSANAQTIVNLWNGVAPGSETWNWKERDINDVVDGGVRLGTIIQNVVIPTLTAYLPQPAIATGTGIIIAPGGGCVALVMDPEGRNVAKQLQKRGIAAFVLKYRLQHKVTDGMPPDLNEDVACKWGIADASQALKVVRQHAREWHLSAQKIGIMGFSAGGMIASETLVQSDTAARPAFAGLIYGAPFASMPPVPKNLPPVFMAWAQDDSTAAADMVRFYSALLRTGNSPEAHIYSSGDHGFAIPKPGTTTTHWLDEFCWWLRAKGFATTSGTRTQ
jgi:acetyl esterase/lipase